MKLISSQLLLVILLPAVVYSQTFTHLGSWSEASCRAVAYHAPLVYYGNGSWVEIVDISDVSSPLPVGRFLMSSSVRILDGGSDALYVGTFDHDLFVVDVGDPSSPTITAELPGISYAIAMQDNVLFVAISSAIVVYDIQDALAPVEIGRLDVGKHISNLTVESDRLFAHVGANDIWAIDVSDPSDPKQLSAMTKNRLTDFTALNDRLYTIGDSLEVFDVSEAASPRRVFVEDRFLRGIEAVGDRLYGFNLGSRLDLFDLSNPDAPSFVSRYESGRPRTRSFGGRAEATFAPGLALLADVEMGLTLIDIEDPQNLLEAGLLFAGGLHYSVSVAGSRAIIASGGPGLTVLDLSDPSAPREVQRFRDIVAEDVIVRGRHVFVAGRPTTIHELVDDQLQLLWNWDIRSTHVSLSGNRAYFVVQRPRAEIAVFDVARPEETVEIGSFVPSGYMRDLAVHGNTVYVAISGVGIEIWDAEDPASAEQVSVYASGESVHSLYIVGDLLYAGTTGETGFVLDVSDPTQPVESTRIAGHYIEDFEMMNDLLLALSGREGIYYQDPSTSSPSLLLGTGFEAAGDDMAISGGRIVISSWEAGVRVFEVEGIVTEREKDLVATRLVQAYPNPFSHSVRFELSAVPARTMKLAVYDVTGRLVKRFDPASSIGSLDWDGRDEHGRQLPAGIYLWKTATGHSVQTGVVVKGG